MARVCRLSIRLNEQERDIITNAAKKDQRTAADWARLVLIAAASRKNTIEENVTV